MNDAPEDQLAYHLRGMVPSVAVTLHAESYPRLGWNVGNRLVDFISRYSGFFFNSPAAMYLDREEVEDATSYILLELIDNAMKYGISGAIDVRIEIHKREMCFVVVNPVDAQEVPRLEDTFQALYSDDPAELLVQKIEDNAANPDRLESGLGLLTILSDYSATVGWHFLDSCQPGSARLSIITRFPVYRSQR